MFKANFLEILEQLQSIPAIDIHSHIPPFPSSEADEGAVLFYHMASYAMRASGLVGAKLWQKAFLHCDGRPFEDFPRFWEQIRHSGFGKGLEIIFKDIYHFEGPLTQESFANLRESIRQKMTESDYIQIILKQGGIKKVLSSRWSMENDPGKAPVNWMIYTAEKQPFAQINDRRSWQELFTYARKEYQLDIHDYDSFCEAVGQFFNLFSWKGKHAHVAWVSSFSDFKLYPKDVYVKILADIAAGNQIDRESSAKLSGFYLRKCLEAVEGKASVFQLVYGIHFYDMKSSQGVNPILMGSDDFINSLPWLLSDFPDMHFNILNGYAPHDQHFCSHALAFANLSLGGFWWHGFYPSLMADLWQKRLDMLPLNRLMAFFSDGYLPEWIYARLELSRRALAAALQKRNEMGLLHANDISEIGGWLFHKTASEIFHIDIDIDIDDNLSG